LRVSGKPGKPHIRIALIFYEGNTLALDQSSLLLMMDSSDSFKSLQDRVSSSLVDTTRTASQIAVEDLGFQRSLNSDVASGLDSQNSRLLDIAARLAKAAAQGPKLKDLISCTMQRP
jgi:hypothetical protein